MGCAFGAVTIGVSVSLLVSGIAVLVTVEVVVLELPMSPRPMSCPPGSPEERPLPMPT